MTMQFTAPLVLQLVNKDKLKLDGHTSDYLPSKNSASRRAFKCCRLAAVKERPLTRQSARSLLGAPLAPFLGC